MFKQQLHTHKPMNPITLIMTIIFALVMVCVIEFQPVQMVWSDKDNSLTHKQSFILKDNYLPLQLVCLCQ